MENEMNVKLAVSSAACIALFANMAIAQAPANEENMIGFSSGTGMGVGGSAGSASSLDGSFSTQVRGSGSGSQSFGGGFNQQQSPGSGPLSFGPPNGAGVGGGTVTGGGAGAGGGAVTGGGAGGPTLTGPSTPTTGSGATR